MSYTDLAVLGVVLALGLDLAVLRTRLVTRKAFWVAYAIILLFQLVTNGVLTGLHVVRYDRDQILGARISYAPVEDLLFGFSLVLQTLAWWVFWGRTAWGRAAWGRRARTARTQAGPATASRRGMPTDTR